MKTKLRAIEVDEETAALLESEAGARNISLADLVSELARHETEPSVPDLDGLRARARTVVARSSG